MLNTISTIVMKRIIIQFLSVIAIYEPSLSTSQEQLETRYNVKQNHSNSMILFPYVMENYK